MALIGKPQRCREDEKDAEFLVETIVVCLTAGCTASKSAGRRLGS
jgi:hypothetical protein